MPKWIRVPVQNNWQPEWNEFTDEQAAFEAASTIKAKTFCTFYRNLVGYFGVCTEDCAAHLWNRKHPDKKRKYIEKCVQNTGTVGQAASTLKVQLP